MRPRFTMPGHPHLRIFACVFALACATPPAPPLEHEQRIEQARQGLENDPTLEAHRAAIDAAMANEQRAKLVEGIELRAGDDYLSGEHQVRAIARVKLRRPAELRAERNALRAETEIELARLEQASLERRVALCFPSVDALVREQQNIIYASYAQRQKVLLDWNEDWRTSGVIDELGSAKFELDSRTKLATRRLPTIATDLRIPIELPNIGSGTDAGELDRSAEHLRRAVRAHHPSVAVHQATAKRDQRLAERANSRRLPGLRFVDLSYEHRSDSSRDGVGGQVAFEIPFGGKAKAEIAHFGGLIRQQHAQASALVEQQISLSLQALNEIHDFESRAEQWRELEWLALHAEQVADQWWKARLAKPAAVAALLDDAYAARIAVLDARERAANASCTLLAMTGVPLEAWSREARDSREPGESGK